MTSSQANREELRGVRPEVAGGIVRVDSRLRIEAVERLVAGGAAPGRSRGGRSAGHGVRALAERFVEFSNANAIAIDAMWAWVDASDRVTATVLAVPNPGRTALLFSSVPAGPDELDPLAAVIRHACDEMRSVEVDLAQVLLEPRDSLQCQGFAAGGFSELAWLSYMERALPGRPTAPRWPEGTTVEPYDEARRDELLELLEDTYVETLDCPGLRGLRRTEDILAGHVGTGAFDAALWTLMRTDGRACGVLMLNPAPASDSVELVYIGLARAARGRGLGRQLLRHGLHQIRRRAERAITLAVDERNTPAIALYRSEGFRQVLRRLAMIHPLRVVHRASPPPDRSGGEKN